MQKNIETWYNRMWLTSSARFNAYRRVQRIYNWSSISIIIFSIYIIGLNLLVFTEGYSSPSSQTNITIVNIILSTFILALSVYLNGHDFKSEFQNLHKCGKDISSIYNKIGSIRDNEDWSHDVSSLIEEYDNVIKLSDYNHSNVDYDKVIIDSPEQDKSCWFIVKVWYSYYLAPILIYLLLIVIPPILICMFMG